MNRRTLPRFMMSLLLLSTYGATLADDAWFTRTVVVGPNSSVGVGYGTYEGAQVLTVILTPQTGYTIASSTCTDNAGLNIWFRQSANGAAHTWVAYGVLPDFVTVGTGDESHAAVFSGVLSPIPITGGGTGGGKGTGTGSSSPIVFDVKVCDIDIDIDALGRHTDAHWSPADPQTDPVLASQEDAIEDGGTNPNGIGGLRMPVTLSQVQPGHFPATLPESTDGWKALRLRLNAKKAGYVYFTASNNTLAVYREILADPAATKQHLMGPRDGIRIEADEYRKETFHIHTSATFSSGHIEAKFVPDNAQGSSLPDAKDDIRVCLAGTAPDLILRDYDFYWNRAYQDFEKKDWATGATHYNRVHNMADYGENAFFNMDLNPQQADASITWEVHDNDDGGELEGSGNFASGWRQFYTYDTSSAGDSDSLTFKLIDGSGNTLVERNARAYSYDEFGDCLAILRVGAWWSSLRFASEAIKTFTEGSNTFTANNPCTTGTYQLAAADRLWTHNCGVAPGLTSPTYTIPAYCFAAGSYVSTAIEGYAFRRLDSPTYAITDHGPYRDWIQSVIMAKKDFIMAQLSAKPNGTSILFDSSNGGPWRGVKDRWDTIKFNRQDFAQPQTGKTTEEDDLNKGIGDACGDIEIAFTVWKDNSGKLRVTWVHATGKVWEIYDFDVYADSPAPIAATVQFGHGRKLNSSGSLIIDNGKVFYDESGLNSQFNWNNGGSSIQIDWIVE